MGNLDWWQGAISIQSYHTGLESAHHITWQWKYLPLVIVCLGGLVGTWFYLWRTDLPAKVSSALGFVYTVVYRKWLVDELYNGLFVKPIKCLSKYLYLYGDVKFIDGFMVNGLGKATVISGMLLRKAQSGYIFHYAFVLVLGVCALMSWFIL